MGDCQNVEMRERLPELMHGVLRADVAAEVRAHVASCAECRAELELLERVRSALSAPTPAVDASRIVAKLPTYRRAPAWVRAMRSSELRAAAAVLLMVGGSYAALSGTRGGDDVGADSGAAVALTAGELAIGDTFQDLTDGDLRAMLDEIAKLEAVTPVATDEDVAPAAERGGRTGADSGGTEG